MADRIQDAAQLARGQAITAAFRGQDGLSTFVSAAVRGKMETVLSRPTLPSQLPTALLRHSHGQQVFAELLRRWMARSGWSYAAMADLAEAAVIALEAPSIPPMEPGARYRSGQLRLANGHVWRARHDVMTTELPKLREKEPNPDWEPVAAVRRIFASQLNNLQRQLLRGATVTVFDTLGRLNEYVAAIKAGKLEPPSDERLRRHALEGIVIADEQGPYGAEEFLSVFLGLLTPPMVQPELDDRAAARLSAQVARDIRTGMREAGLDLVDDWPQFLSCYPTSDPDRLAKIRDVTMGSGTWSVDSVSDEAAAVKIALARLAQRHGRSALKLEGKPGSSNGGALLA